MDRRLKFTWYIATLAGLIILGNQSIHLHRLFENEKNIYTDSLNDNIISTICEFNMFSTNRNNVVSFNAKERELIYIINGKRIQYQLTEKEDLRQINEQYGYDTRDRKKWTLKNFHQYLQIKLDSTTREKLVVKSHIQDSTGKIKDSYNANKSIPYKCEYSMPLGFISGDTLHVTYSYPINHFLEAAKGDIIVILGISLLLALCIISLIRTIRMEKKSSEYREQFVHALVHDLKRPIENEIKIRELLYKDAPSHRAPLLEKSQHELSNMIEAINRMLLRSTDAHGLRLNRKEFDLHALLKMLCDPMNWNVGESKIFLMRLDYQSQNQTITADNHFLHAVFQNLIENALKYSREQVEINIVCKDTPDHSVCIEIQDNGQGIAPDALKHIFERHNRGKHNGDQNIKGYGIGLHFVRTVIRAHGGNITVKSEEGKGSTFIISLPTKNKSTSLWKIR